MIVRPPVGYAPVGSRVRIRGNRVKTGTDLSCGTMALRVFRMVKWDE